MAAWKVAAAMVGLGETVEDVLVAAARRVRAAVGLAWAEMALGVAGSEWAG